MIRQEKFTELTMSDIVNVLQDETTITNFVPGDSLRKAAGYVPSSPFMFDGMILSICIKGSAKVKINFKEYEIKAGSVITILPHRIFNVDDRSPDLLVETLFMGRDFLVGVAMPTNYDVLMQFEKEPVINVGKESMYSMLELHTLIVKHYQNVDNPLREAMVKSLLCSLLISFGAYYIAKVPPAPEGKSSRSEELTEKFFRLLVDNFRQHRSVSYYASEMCLTPKYLSATVKSVTGRSILEWINEAVIIEAKKMLKTTDLTVLQISEELNFPNPSFFGRFFKQYTGQTPFKYKNS